MPVLNVDKSVSKCFLAVFTLLWTTSALWELSNFVNNPLANPELNLNNDEVTYLCGGMINEVVLKKGN